MLKNGEKMNEEVETSEPRIILIGTYKGDQLKNWAGWYCYPISDEDKDITKYAARINELWLFKGKTEQKTFTAEYVGIKTREELIKEYDYPAKGKAHGEMSMNFPIPVFDEDILDLIKDL